MCATTSPSASVTKWRGASATCWCIGRGPRARSRLGIARFRRTTGTWGSRCSCRAAWGRLMSRTAVRKGRDARQETKKLEEAGILVRSETRDGILEELPEAYKNVDEVIEVVHCAGLARKVARLRPMGVIKG